MTKKTFPALSRRGLANAGLVALVAVAVVAMLRLGSFVLRDVPVTYEDPLEHFKYGSIGAEPMLGIPRPIFEVLPSLFEDLLPPGAGTGYERLGFLYEPGHPLPVGISERSRLVPLVGLNCAACHAGTIRRSPGAPPELLPGAPATRFNSGAFLQFMAEAGSDPRFESGRLLAAMEERHLALSWAERALYRLVVIPRLRARLLELRGQLSWMQRRPAFGPGRADTANPYKVLFGMDMALDESIGTADYLPLYNQGIHRGATLHWSESATPASSRLAAWLQELQPPVFPRERIDLARAEHGRSVWERECAECHAIGGRLVGQVTPVVDVGTDPERLRSLMEGLVARWESRSGSVRAANGYANVPLDGVWVRSPYLHNGSVPTLWDLLHPEERPEAFFRGYDVYDWERAGNVASGSEAEKAGFRYDTRLRGNHNTGHLYGTKLPEPEKGALLEYLKTL